jgi:diaminopropionate ammonia-lyase
MTDEREKARFFLNPNPSTRAVAPRSTDHAPLAFHQRLPGYCPTPLIDASELARMLGIGQLMVKNESNRLGLPAFKILGASWAVYRALEERIGHSLEPWETVVELAERLVALRPLTLVTATDGNHGRAVAHMAALLGFEAQIYLPIGTAKARVDGIASEGARVEIVNGTYDDAVERAAQDASARCLVISDTSWPGYEDIPRWVIEGYSTILVEIDHELARRGEKKPELIAVQFGVGALATAVVKHSRGPSHNDFLKIVSVEPLHAACMLASMEAGEIVTVPGPHDSIMAGLNCGRPSDIAWPIASRGINAFIAIPDERAREAMRALAGIGIVAGETGGAGLAGLIELLTGLQNAQYRQNLKIDRNTRALILVTEGATDPEGYKRAVRRNPEQFDVVKRKSEP